MRVPSPPRQPWLLRVSLLLAIGICTCSLALDSLPIAVKGRAFDTDWNPVAHASASLLVDGKIVARATANAYGVFSLSGGHGFQPYRISVSAPGYVPSLLDLKTGTALLHELGSVSGQVQDDAGAPVAGALVAVDSLQLRKRWSVRTGADGWFSISRQLLPGRFDLVVVAPQHDAFETTIRVSQDTTLAVAPVIARQLGTLSITTDPAGIQPLLDGKPLPDCPATPCTAAVVIGRHTLSVDNDLYEPWQQVVDVARNATQSIAQPLVRKTGTLVVNGAGIGGAVLSVDGNAVPSGWRGLLPTGAHVVSERGPSIWPQSSTAQVNWNQETDINLAPTGVVTGSADAFTSQLQAYLNSAGGGQYGVYLRDLTSGQEMGSGQDSLMEAASVIKIPVALYTYSQSEAGQLNLDDKVTLQGADFMGGTGTLISTANPGDQYSYRDLVALLIQQSDNTAWRALRRALNSSAIDAYAAAHGAPQCHQVDDNCTPRQAGLLLTALYSGAALNPADTQVLLNLLETTAFNDRINYYLGGTTIAHKVGMDGGVMNDAGIVYLSGRPFIISMFTDTDDPDQGVQAIRDVSRAAYWFYSH